MLRLKDLTECYERTFLVVEVSARTGHHVEDLVRWILKTKSELYSQRTAQMRVRFMRERQETSRKGSATK